MEARRSEAYILTWGLLRQEKLTLVPLQKLALCMQKFYPSSYVILSAKYGFMFPDEIIPASYNVTFKNHKTNPITIEKLKKRAEEKGLTKYDEIVVIAGSSYVSIIKKVFPEKKIITSLKGAGGMGAMISTMKKAMAKGSEIIQKSEQKQ